MEFRISKEIFVKALQKVQGIVEKRNTMPILSNVLIEAVEDRIEITATDLEVGMKSSYATEVLVPGKITVSAKKLYEIIKELPDETISFSTRENDWLHIRCGKAQFNIVGLSPDEFPYFPRVSDDNLVRLEAGMLGGMIEKISYAICHDETKYNLNGVFIHGTDALKMVATDGHRLAIIERPVNGPLPDILAKGVIFPRKGIFELKKLAEEEKEEILLGFMDNNAVIRKGNTTIVMRLVDGEFPDYNRVIPAGNDKDIRFRREAMLHSLRRMAILSSEKYKGIKLETKGNVLEISSSNPELGEASEEVEVAMADLSLNVRFNARYLIDVLSICDDEEMLLKLKDELSPAVVSPVADDGFLAVIMPMRL